MTDTSFLETKIAIQRTFLVAVAVLLAGAFTFGAVSTGMWAWLIAPPMNLVGIALVIMGQRVRRVTRGSRGTATSVIGSLFIVGSIWAAFLLGNAVHG